MESAQRLDKGKIIRALCLQERGCPRWKIWVKTFTYRNQNQTLFVFPMFCLSYILLYFKNEKIQWLLWLEVTLNKLFSVLVYLCHHPHLVFFFLPDSFFYWSGIYIFWARIPWKAVCLFFLVPTLRWWWAQPALPHCGNVSFAEAALWGLCRWGHSCQSVSR